jgi:hypothetical protein
MLTPAQALAKAQATTSWAVGMCDNFVANMFGFTSSGYNRAIDNWNAVPVADRHLGDTNAPAGALEFWSGGSTGAGHVAISTGDGNIISTDQPSAGRVSEVPASTISNNWHETYLGWTPPYFQGSMGQVGSTVTQAGDTTQQAGSVANTFLSDLLGLGGSKTSFKDIAERFGLILLGTIFIIVAVWKFTSVGAKAETALKNSGNGSKKAAKEKPEAAEDA